MKIKINKYSNSSRNKLDECHTDLQKIFETVLPDFDHTIICGHRGEKAQNDAFKRGTTKLAYPRSKHNKIPSLAVDVMPYPINYADTKRIAYFAGFVMATAKNLLEQGLITHSIRWGGDWDADTDLSDNTLNDMPHYEIVG